MGGQTFSIDRFARICRITGTGMWSPEDTHAHFDEAERALQPLRESDKPILFLVDMREAVVQSRETAQAMSERAALFHRPTDIIAVVTQTMLLALQVKRHARIGRVETFHDMDEAKAWAEAQRALA